MSPTNLILPLLSLLALVAACEQTPPATPATPAAPAEAAEVATLPAEVVPSELALQRVERMRERAEQSPCSKGEQADLWNKHAEESRTTYIAGRYMDSIKAAQSAFALCEDPGMMRHIAHCYQIVGMPMKAHESTRRLKGSLRKQYRSRTQKQPDPGTLDAEPARTQEQ
jgi:hypothetical protein